jgi:transcriptional regulator with XRE-family HTH domain
MSDFNDKIMERLREKFRSSGISLDELGRNMGYPDATARKSAWQFLNKTADPRLSMMKKTADALGLTMAELFREAD